MASIIIAAIIVSMALIVTIAIMATIVIMVIITTLDRSNTTSTMRFIIYQFIYLKKNL